MLIVKPAIKYLLPALLLISTHSTAKTCHYQDWRWNVIQKSVVQRIQVVKPYAEITTEEHDPLSGCSVCREDQQAITIQGLPEFLVCKKIASQIQNSLQQLIRNGEKINSVIGYRVGRTRGPVDAQGNRTEFSNHSFGIAIDINTEHNGLYNNCVHYNAQCRLTRGGPWLPGKDPFSLEANGKIVNLFKAAGFKWGGEIAGQQKDFMHFSLTGY
jgi:hypothetical protein